MSRWGPSPPTTGAGLGAGSSEEGSQGRSSRPAGQELSAGGSQGTLVLVTERALGGARQRVGSRSEFIRVNTRSIDSVLPCLGAFGACGCEVKR